MIIQLLHNILKGCSQSCSECSKMILLQTLRKAARDEVINLCEDVAVEAAARYCQYEAG